MKKHTILIALLAITSAVIAAHASPQISFGDITNWVGSGSNQSALIVDWHEGNGLGNDYKIWGYNWDNSAEMPTVETMITAIAAADTDFYVLWNSSTYGKFATGFGYDTDGDGFSINRGGTNVPFTDGTALDNDYSGNELVDDPDDTWNPDTADSFQFFTATGSSIDPDTDWTSSGSGVSGTTLSDNSWAGFDYYWGDGSPAAVPEPSAILLLLAGAGLLTWARKASSSKV